MKTRKEMNPEFTWDLTHIFKDRAEWEKACAECEEEIKKLPAIEGTLGKSADCMKKGLDQLYSTLQKAELIYIYTMLQKSQDGGEAEYQEMDMLATSLIVRASTALAFINPEILAIPEKKLDRMIKDKKLEGYRHILEDIARGRAHTLDAAGEKLLARLGDASGTPSQIFDMISEVDFTYPIIKDAHGNDVQITNGTYGMLRESEVREVRVAAFEGYLGKYKEYINTIAATYGGSVKLDSYFAQVRNYQSAVERALDGNNVPVAVYDSLVKAVREAIPSMNKYLALRKKTLGLEKLDLYDLYIPMLPDVDFKMPYEDGKELVLKAMAPLGERYVSLLKKAMDEKWIDVYENKGKSAGAYSCGVYGVHPYVLLNYTDTLDDAFTLAHELGHSMHSYFSSERQSYANHDYSIMAAEVASTVNEVLLSLYLLKTETDKKRRAAVLNHLLESFRTTVFRQTLFAEFERNAHDMYQNGTPLTASSLSEMYKKLLGEYYAGADDINDMLSYEWSYVSHFYREFYVYQYATGFCSAVAIAKRITETGDASSYLEFLSLGGSDYPIEELKVAGVDLTKPDTVASALKLFDETIDELAALLDEINAQ